MSRPSAVPAVRRPFPRQLSALACASLLAASASSQVTVHFEDAHGPCGKSGFVTGPTVYSAQGVTLTSNPDTTINIGANHTLFPTDSLHFFTYYSGALITFPEPMARVQLDLAAHTPQQTYPTLRLLATDVVLATFGVNKTAPTKLDLVLDPPASSVVIQYVSGSSGGVLIDRLFASPDAGVGDAIAHWSMEPSSPAGALTDILHGHHGQLAGAAHVSGVVGDALQFAPGDSALVPDQSALDLGTGDFSVALWLRATVGGGPWPLLDKRELVSETRGYHLYLHNGGLGVQLADGTHQNFGSTMGVNDGTWHHVAVTVDRDQPDGIRFYKDGVQLAATGNPTARTGTLANAKPLNVGAHSNGLSWFNGSIDELLLAGRVLSANEIALLAAGATSSVPNAWADLGAPLAGTLGAPVLAGSGTLAPDSWNALTLTNAAPDAQCVLFVSLDSNPANFKGGLLKTVPFIASFDLTTFLDGTIPMTFQWPADIPSDTPTYYQYAIVDDGAPFGVAISNAVMGLTP